MFAEQITALMRQQWGLVSRQQLLDIGLSANTIKSRVRRQHLAQVAAGVYRAPSSTHSNSWDERLMAACLQGAPHAVASHRSAACLWHLDDFFYEKPEPLQVTIPRNKELRISDVEVFITRSPVTHPATKNGIPCTSLPRTLIDLCLIVPVKAVEVALDSALRRKPIWRKWIRSEVETLPRRHRSRTILLALLDEREFTFDSKPEIDLNHLIWSSGLRGGRVHHPIYDEAGRFIGNVDFCFPDLRLFIQFHGLEFHLRGDRFRIDQWQVSQLASRGWTPIITTKDELTRDPVGFVRNLQRAYQTCCERQGITPNLVLGP